MPKKVCIFHDHFMYRGGGERLVVLMAKALGCDLISGFFDDGSLNPRDLGFKGNIIEISKPFFAFFDKRSYTLEKKSTSKKLLHGSKFILFKGLRHFFLKIAFLFKSQILKNYDIVIFSGDSLGAIRNCKNNAKIYYYCHTPPRYLYDQKNEYLAKVPGILKFPYKIACLIFEKLYKKDFNKVQKIITNSSNTQKRIDKFLGKKSEIIYPPVDISFFKPSKIRKDYYFSFARLSSIKRVDRIVETFKQMPDKKLKFVYGINDPEREKILNCIKGFKNIEAIKSPDDKNLRKLISESIATIYIPVNEDFGMSPIESMACGVPVIGVDDGGLKESIIDRKTGILIDKEAKISDLKKAILSLNLEKSMKMKDSCIKQANIFSLEEFEKKIKEVIK